MESTQLFGNIYNFPAAVCIIRVYITVRRTDCGLLRRRKLKNDDWRPFAIPRGKGMIAPINQSLVHNITLWIRMLLPRRDGDRALCMFVAAVILSLRAFQLSRRTFKLPSTIPQHLCEVLVQVFVRGITTWSV